MKIQLPREVKRIIQILSEGGFEAYTVGGSVRDSLLGKVPKDWDITTDAKPEEVKALFHRTIDTGIQHGTVTVMMNGRGYEVTTYRIDGQYLDSRHPEEVTFTANLKEDLRRRDFTINAMAYNETNGLQDYFGGQEDLQKGIVRAVGVAAERFTEDALRILRAVRFAAQLGFTIEEQTLAAAKALSGRISFVSAERIREELLKILTSEHPDYVGVLDDVGALEQFYDEYAPKKEEINALLLKVPAEKVIRLSVFFGRSGKDLVHSYKIAERVLDFLRFDNETKNSVLHVIRFSDVKLTTDRVLLRRFLNACGRESYENILLYLENVENIDMAPVRREIEGIVSDGECTSLKELAISGKDLIKLGMRPGREMGEILMELLADVLTDPGKNDRERLLERAKALQKELPKKA